MRFTGDDALTLATLLFFAFIVMVSVGWWLILTLAFCEVAGDFWGWAFGAGSAALVLLAVALTKAGGR